MHARRGARVAGPATPCRPIPQASTSTSSSSAPVPRAAGPPSASPRPACAWPCSRPDGRSPTPTTRSTSSRTQLKYRGRTKAPLERTQPQQSQSYAVREWNADWYVNDIEEPYLDDSDPEVRVGAPARRRRPDEHLGTRLPAHERHRLQGGVARRRRRRLADHLRGDQAVLRPRRGVRRRVRHEGRARAVPGRSVPAADGPDLQRDGGPLARQEGVRVHASRRAAPPTSPGRSTAARRVTTAGRASTGA